MKHDVMLLIDPFSRHFERNALFNEEVDRRNGASILAPWTYLRDWFAARGIPVHTADCFLRGEADASKFVYVSFGLLNHYRAIARRPGVLASAFFEFESPVITPDQYEEIPELQKYFKRIFTFTDAQALAPFLRAPLQSELFHLPYPHDGVNEELWSRRDRKFLIMMNHNKLPAVYWHELYTERMRAVQYFARWNEIDLYGLGWDGPSYQMGWARMPGSLQKVRRELQKQWQRLAPVPLLETARRVYRGSSISKLDTISQYKFMFCFENVVLKGWVTEKIFDCLVTGTIPIYWGATDVDTFVPPDCFIDMRQFESYDELRRFLKSLDEKSIEEYREKGRAYLCSPQFQPFTKQAFVDIMARLVEEDAGVQLRESRQLSAVS
ncbi:MAG: glycosyltransferase family 10 domain-containing protein [Candidatus Acidiferrales bacterium]